MVRFALTMFGFAQACGNAFMDAYIPIAEKRKNTGYNNEHKHWQEIIKKHHVIIFPRESILPEFVQTVKDTLQLQEIPENVILMQDIFLLLKAFGESFIIESITIFQMYKDWQFSFQISNLLHFKMETICNIL